MKLLSRDQIENLAKFRSPRYLMTSFYVDTKKRDKTKKEITLGLKNLLNVGKTRLEEMGAPKEKKDSLAKDLEKISRFCTQALPSFKSAGLAVFSCSGEGFWQELSLPNSPRNRVVFDQNAYVRPLSAILNDHTRICTLTIDRREARWYDIFMGEIFPLDSMKGDVPKKVKEGGWEGYESKRIERHITAQLRDFFKKAAKNTFTLFKANEFDWLFLSCPDESFADLEALLHPYLKRNLKGRLRLKPGDAPDKVLAESLKLVKELKIQEKDEILKRFISELEKGGRAVSGLKNSLRAVNRGEVQTLLITRHLSKPGHVCPKCKFLYTEELECPSCLVKTDPTLDVIDEAVEAALDKNGHIRHINPPSSLNKYGDIGALLRYKV